MKSNQTSFNILNAVFLTGLVLYVYSFVNKYKSFIDSILYTELFLLLMALEL